MHVGRKRFLEISENNLRMAEWELNHVESCKECLDRFAEMILQDARARAARQREKEKSERDKT
jgi:hypothetical protein